MEYIALNNICDVRDGTHDSPKYVQEGFPLVTSKNIVDGKLDLSTVSYITQEDYDKINERSKVDEGDIIMPMIGTIGNPLLIEDFCEFAIKNVALIKFPNQETCNKYIWYFLKSGAFKKYVDEKNKGGTQKFLSLGDIRGMKVPILEYSEQIAVVEKFDAVYKVISERNEELQLLDDLIKARFVEMFGNPITNPKGYTKITVEEAIEVGYIEKPFDGNHGGKHPKASEYVETGIPFLMANNVNDGTVDLANCSFITERRANRLDKGFAKDNDVLITHKGTIGRTAVLRTDYKFVMLTPQVAAYRVKRGITSEYLCGYFGTDYFQNDMKMLASSGGSTRAYAGITAQLKLRLIIPPLDEQREYTDFVHQVDKSKVAVQKALDETQLLFDSLMQQYFG